jgi:hypothetical protein
LPSNRTLDSASSEAIPGKPSRIAREHLDSVCPRASDRKSAGIVFRGNDFRVSLPPPVGAGIEPRILRGDNHANSITQKARTLGRENANQQSEQTKNESRHGSAPAKRTSRIVRRGQLGAAQRVALPSAEVVAVR